MSADFLTLQRQFAAHLRNPDENPAPEGIEDRRLNIYRQLFFNNVRNFLEQGFPVLYSLLPDPQWQQLVRAFFHRHACHSPYFVDIPEQFVSFLMACQQDDDDMTLAEYPSYILELAHYEWLELALDASTETAEQQGADPQADLLATIPVVNPVHALHCYQYPVHTISAEHADVTPGEQPYWLLVYRNRQLRVGFMALNGATARLLQLLLASPKSSGRQVVLALAEELGHADPEALLQFAHSLLEQWREKSIILGGRLPGGD